MHDEEQRVESINEGVYQQRLYKCSSIDMEEGSAIQRMRFNSYMAVYLVSYIHMGKILYDILEQIIHDYSRLHKILVNTAAYWCILANSNVSHQPSRARARYFID